LSAEPELQAPGLGALLGPRLRERRLELGRTLTGLARAVNLSPGYLSTIENGASVPSLPVLARLTHALDVSLAEILRSSSSARLARGHITDGSGNSDLAPEGSQLEIVRHSASPDDAGEALVSLGHRDVFVYVYLGRLEVSVDDEVFELAPGDALHCDRPSRMSWRVLGAERVVALWTTAQGGPRSQREPR
jgi:transcriptional regulator with XRE-family HTH domain